MSSSEEEDSNTGTGSEDEFHAKHTCTDIPCAALFVTALVVFIGVMIWALAKGDTRKMSHGIDVNGQLCGLSANVSDRPFLYYCPRAFEQSLGLLRIDTKYPVCVASCPNGTFDALTNVTYATPAVISSCPPAVSQAYLAEPMAGLYCLPKKYYSAKALSEVHAATADALDSVHSNAASTLTAWPVLVLVVIAATVLGYVYLWLLRVTAKILIWLCVIVSMAVLVGLGVYVWMNNEGLVPEAEDDANEQAVQRREWARHGLKALAMVLWGLAGMVLCLACCCGRSIELSTACVQTATMVIWRMPLMLLSPFVKAITKSFFALLFIYGFMHLWAMGEVTGTGLHRRYSHTPEQWGVIIFYMFVAYWVLSYITAIYQFSCAYAVAKYYQAPRDEEGHRDVDSFAVMEGTVVGVSKHTGSLAYGAAIIAALEVAQRILEYVERKNDELGEEANKCVRCMLRSCLCCCKCVEGIIQFINQNAYIDIAVTGNNSFCKAVRNVMKVVIDFGPAMAILNGATYIFQIVGMAAITALCGLLASAVLSSSPFSDPASDWFIDQRALPIALSCFLALTVAWAFMAIFDVTTDTLLYCYAEDKNSHDGEAANAPKDMRKLYEEAEKTAADQKAQKAQRDAAKGQGQKKGPGRYARARE
eukprot:CAMPEP_0204593744 /NCGR_PEP_ID=MMETSP0661-20131031/51680_1 /ASSEMBLY_ACC=CAM_ASM_000606 /TAXON_ID=109239 /ORGANISM="Alexandrium margalefi, Strain AMGDE01CS-322" /LENGTH=646 /DNA_ID=CAMNT_0051604083 /DNA_START=56 /DNA_END=1996 /DNA_ORIENTATION=+